MKKQPIIKFSSFIDKDAMPTLIKSLLDLPLSEMEIVKVSKTDFEMYNRVHFETSDASEIFLLGRFFAVNSLSINK